MCIRDRYMEALAMPKATPEEQTARKAAMQEGLKAAAQVPMEVAETVASLFPALETAVRKGNPNAVTDGMVGTMSAVSYTHLDVYKRQHRGRAFPGNWRVISRRRAERICPFWSRRRRTRPSWPGAPPLRRLIRYRNRGRCTTSAKTAPARLPPGTLTGFLWRTAPVGMGEGRCDSCLGCNR